VLYSVDSFNPLGQNVWLDAVDFVNPSLVPYVQL
jgi:hypothetical protein